MEAQFTTSVRQPDWRGYHTGTFTIYDGTNVFATGNLVGDNGVGSHGALEACASGSHLEGTLTGVLTAQSDLPGGRIQATYAGDIGVTCVPDAPPQGPVTLYLDGVVITTTCIAHSSRTVACTWIADPNPSSGVGGGVQLITGAQVYPDIDMGDGTFYFGVTVGVSCLSIPNTDLIMPVGCPTGAYQDAQTASCSSGGCTFSFNITNISVR